MRMAAALAGVLILTLLPVVPAAADDPYAADPNRLVPFIDTVQQPYSSGTDTWEVWICDVPDWSTPVDLASTVSSLNSNLGPYFQWLSGGNYTASFVVGGTVTSNDVITEDSVASQEQPFSPDCESQVASASTGGSNGALIVIDAPFDAGYATAGAICPEAPFSGCTISYPGNSRRAVVAAAAVTTVAPLQEPQWITVAHEIGHALNWAHSYGGLTKDPSTGATSHYDNPMDVMSGDAHNGMPIGAIAYHRYAAGWIEPQDVATHVEGTGIYELAPIGASGIGMVVIPTGVDGHFYTVSARRKAGFDSKLPKAGVEIYEVDQRREIACIIPESWPQTWPCFATLIRIAQLPAIAGVNGTDHVLGIDEEQTVAGFTVKVMSASSANWTVRIAERDSGTFIDDDGNIHEANIEAIAAAGITRGCNPPTNDHFCPDRSVTRAEMAAFIIRALGLEDQMVGYQGTFSDIPADEWYTPYVETLAQRGITTGYSDGTYRPGNEVSRAEMAVFIVRSFGPDAVPKATGIFVDVPATAWFAPSVEQIYRDGVTKGCRTDPLTYCPGDSVRRDQMASFLARALGIGN